MATAKRAKKIRSASEFNPARLSAALRPPMPGLGAYSWTLDEIRDARDQQLRGQFCTPARMAESMRTDDALFTAYENRLAPARCIGVEMVPAAGAGGKRIAAEAEALFGQNGVGVRSDALADINGCLANHGLAVGVCTHTARADGSRVDVELHSWPIEYVRYDPVLRSLVTQIDPATPAEQVAREAGTDRYSTIEIPITHGDGRWVVFQKHEYEPWKQEACILSAALIWARHAHAVRDWARGSSSHGNAKVVGEMPEGMALSDEDGALTVQAAAFLELLQAIASLDMPVGIRPAGSKTDLITNTSTAWQVWDALAINAEKAAARIYLGTDGMLGSVGGAPGVDIATLFGVAVTKVQGDLACLERGLMTGVIEPWAAVNFGSSALAPRRRYLMPDADEQAMREAYGKRSADFHADIKARRDAGHVIDQALLDELASRYDVIAPQLPVESSKAPSIALAPTDIARVVSVNEARASAGLGVLLLATGQPDPLGVITVEEFSAKKAAQAAAPAPATPAPVLRSVGT